MTCEAASMGPTGRHSHRRPQLRTGDRRADTRLRRRSGHQLLCPPGQANRFLWLGRADHDPEPKWLPKGKQAGAADRSGEPSTGYCRQKLFVFTRIKFQESNSSLGRAPNASSQLLAEASGPRYYRRHSARRAPSRPPQPVVSSGHVLFGLRQTTEHPFESIFSLSAASICIPAPAGRKSKPKMISISIITCKSTDKEDRVLAKYLVTGREARQSLLGRDEEAEEIPPSRRTN